MQPHRQIGLREKNLRNVLHLRVMKNAQKNNLEHMCQSYRKKGSTVLSV